MTLYAGRSVCSLYVSNYEGGTFSSCNFYNDVPAQLEVNDLVVEFRVHIEFHDHPYFDNGRGRFTVWLDVASASGGWAQVDDATLPLGNDSDDGDWYSHLTVSHTMSNPMELYRLRVECGTRHTSSGSNVQSSRVFTCTQAVNFLGNFTLDYIPLSIVYCPPGQDMTNSLSQTDEFGSQFTIGNSAGLQASQGPHAGGSLWGIASVEEGVQESQSATNTAVNSLRTTYFRNTVLTADNQRAIGRAFWGPLSDLFVVMVNPRFACSRRADGTIFYEHQSCDQVIVVPAHKLLRPGTDPIASAIPPSERRKLLELDPFITNLDRFFPDVGTHLREAANPFVDPSANGRAECIGIWHMSTGVELNYSVGDSIKLRQEHTEELTWSTNMHGSAAVVIGGAFDANMSIGIQWSLEASERHARSAACYLIKNQNDPSPEGIQIYYDKLFSTLMFRRLRPQGRRVAEVPEFLKLFPDVPIKMILYKLLQLLPDFGVPSEPPKVPLDIRAADFGIAESFPDLPEDLVARVVDRLNVELLPNHSLVGSARDAAGHPMYFENVALQVGKEVLYRTFSDGVGAFRFDNILPGTYTLRVGDKRHEVTVGLEETYLNPHRVEVNDAVRVIDFKTAPRGKLRSLLGIDNTDLERLIMNHENLHDIHDVASFLKIGEAARDVLAKRVIKA